MNNSILALLLYAAWTLLLLGGIASLRVYLTASGQRRANSFSTTGDDVSPFSGRLCRAHANCYENLPTFVAIIAVAAFTNQTQITDPLALWVVLARVGQSTAHLYSTRNRFIQLRFLMMLIQYLIQAFWVVQLVLHGL